MCYDKLMKLRTKILTILTALALVIATITVPAIAKTLEELNQDREATAAKIEAKKQEIAALEAELSRIAGEVASYQNAIYKINLEISLLDEQIAVTEAEYNDLVAQITVLELKIENNKDALGIILLELYKTKNVSLIERIASSESLSSFIDKEAQLDNLSAEISNTVSQIESDKAALEAKKLAAKQKLDDLDAQKAEQTAKKSEQQSLLNLSQQQQSEFTSKKRTADAEKVALEAEQRAILKEIAAQTGAGDPNKGGYPYAYKCPKYIDAHTDPWSMYICECVSYTAWKVHEQYLMGAARLDMPNWGGRGNAKYWYNNAGTDGIPRGSTPKLNSVGVITSGPYGHVVWVESIGSGARTGQIYVSEYNNIRGEYSESWYYISSFQGFVYFNER